MVRAFVAAGVVLATLSGGTAQAGDHTGALLGGFAAGAVGGALLGAALTPRPAPVYAPPRPVYVEPTPVYVAPPPPPPRVYVRQVVASPYDGQMYDLHEACEDGNRRACIRYGIFIGRHRERVAEWRRMHPDYIFD